MDSKNSIIKPTCYRLATGKLVYWILVFTRPERPVAWREGADGDRPWWHLGGAAKLKKNWDDKGKINVRLIYKPMNTFTTNRRPEQHLYNTLTRIRQFF